MRIFDGNVSALGWLFDIVEQRVIQCENKFLRKIITSLSWALPFLPFSLLGLLLALSYIESIQLK